MSYSKQKLQQQLAINVQLEQIIIETAALLKDILKKNVSENYGQEMQEKDQVEKDQENQNNNQQNKNNYKNNSQNNNNNKYNQYNQKNKDNNVSVIHPVTMFDNPTLPTISIQQYLRRIHKLTNFSPSSLIICIIIMDKFTTSQHLLQQFYLTPYNLHRFLLTCLLLAVKFHDDFYFDNRAYQTAGGVNIIELHKYQLHVWEIMGYNLYINQEEYQKYKDMLEEVYGRENSSDSEDETDEDEQNC